MYATWIFRIMGLPIRIVVGVAWALVVGLIAGSHRLALPHNDDLDPSMEFINIWHFVWGNE